MSTSPVDSKSVVLRPKQYLVLSTLVRHQGQAVSVREVISVLWGDDPPVNYGIALRGYVAGLRDVLDPERGLGDHSAIEAGDFGYLYRSRH
jgi:DNA-binding SARP family transcriptional activator